MVELDTLCLLFFRDSKPSHIFAKIIQLGSKANDRRANAVNHVAYAYIHEGKKYVYESLLRGGIQINDYDSRVGKYKGTIWEYPIVDLKVTSEEIHKYSLTQLGKKYDVLGAVGAFEFKSKFLRPINFILDKLKFLDNTKGEFCSMAVSNAVVHFCTLGTKNKLNKIYTYCLNFNRAREVTPQDLKDVCERYYNGYVL